MNAERVLIETPPAFYDDKNWFHGRTWPAHWLKPPREAKAPFVAHYVLPVEVEEDQSIRIHVSADERYALYLDGERIGRGPERGDPTHWRYETYDLHLEEGSHILAAQVWAFGDKAPFAQMSVCPGFILCPDDSELVESWATGKARWFCLLNESITPRDPAHVEMTGHRIELDGKLYPWDWVMAQGREWEPARIGKVGKFQGAAEWDPEDPLLVPATLPAMVEQPFTGLKARSVTKVETPGTHAVPLRESDNLEDEREVWQEVLDGETAVCVPPNTRRRILVDADNYVCAYTVLKTSGGSGATVRIHWAESLYGDLKQWSKGNRDEIEGKYFTATWHHKDAVGDLFQIAGRSGEPETYESLDWHAGRYIELLVETNNDPLTIDSFELLETHYPYDHEGSFECNDDQLSKVVPISKRALEMCSHETYMDCPYYERLMYAGDTRIEILVTYALTRDDRLPRKAIQTFCDSKDDAGLTRSRHPSRRRQTIPPFSLWWTCMLHDHLMWRGDLAFLQSLAPAAREVLDRFDSWRGEHGLVHSPHGWNYVDWVPGVWGSGEPAGAAPGEICAPINWQVVLAMKLFADVEDALGEEAAAERWRTKAEDLSQRLVAHFYSEDHGLLAHDAAKTVFSEHSQVLSLLSGTLTGDVAAKVSQKLFETPGLVPCSVYFSYYYLEVCKQTGRMDRLFRRLDLWREMIDHGFRTTYELDQVEVTRSDCHAWGAHPFYHFLCSVLGMRPGSAGFSSLDVRPDLGPLQSACGVLPSPKGDVRMTAERRDGRLSVTILVPKGLPARIWDGKWIELASGEQTVEVQA